MLPFKYHYQKTFSPVMKPCEPFLLFQTGELYGNADTAIAEHEQPCHELTFVVSGCGTSFADGVPTDIAAGDCYLSFEGERHKIVSDAKNPLRYKFLGFRALDGATEKLLQNFEEFRDGRKRLAHVPELDGLFMALFEELERESIFSDKMIGSIILNMVITLLRQMLYGAKSQFKIEPTNENMLVYQIIHYIDRHLLRIKNLYELSAVFNYEYQYLSGIFSRIMNTSLRDYYRRLKMEKANKLLAEEDRTVTDISELLGYSSVHAFTKAFTVYYGASPIRFRQTGSLPQPAP